MQWWYGHNAVAFFLTTPFLGLMYYFLPKAAEPAGLSPTGSRSSTSGRWSSSTSGPARTTCSTPRCRHWASTLGMLFSVMLWMPSWGGMLNGLLTLRGAWDKVAEDPVLKFFVVAVTFYGMSTFEGPLLSDHESVNALSHYTDWTIAHVHAGALGWNGFMAVGMFYWLVPRLFQTELWSKKLAETHFWIGTIGILLYIVAIYVAGLTQGLMWRAFDDDGYLAYPDFVETTLRLIPMYWVRVIGGTALPRRRPDARGEHADDLAPPAGDLRGARSTKRRRCNRALRAAPRARVGAAHVRRALRRHRLPPGALLREPLAPALGAAAGQLHRVGHGRRRRRRRCSRSFRRS